MTIAILAHDSRKELALQFCTAYSAILSRNNVIATGTTGRMLAQTTGLPVHCYLSGKLGGVQQITSRYDKAGPRYAEVLYGILIVLLHFLCSYQIFHTIFAPDYISCQTD